MICSIWDDWRNVLIWTPASKHSLLEVLRKGSGYTIELLYAFLDNHFTNTLSIYLYLLFMLYQEYSRTDKELPIMFDIFLELSHCLSIYIFFHVLPNAMSAPSGLILWFVPMFVLVLSGFKNWILKSRGFWNLGK